MGLISLIIDSREPAQIQKLKFGGVDKVVSELDAGDLLAACDDGELLVVERKTPSDLLNTLRADRLFPQLAKLREVTRWAYLVITGGLYPGANDKCWFEDGSALGTRETGWTWSSVQGALLTCQEVGVHVVWANGELDYEGTVQRLANRNRQTLRVAPARDVSMLSEWEAVLAALPHIGPERAQALIAVCGTPAWALQFLSDDQHKDTRVPGVSTGLKRITRDALGLDDSQTLAIVIREPAVVPSPPAAIPTPDETPARELAGVTA